MFVTEGGFLYQIEKSNFQSVQLPFSTAFIDVIEIYRYTNEYTLVHSPDGGCVGGALFRVENDSGTPEQVFNCVRGFAVGHGGAYVLHYGSNTTVTSLTRINLETLSKTPIGSLDGVLSQGGVGNVSVNDDAAFVCLTLLDEEPGGPRRRSLLRVEFDTGTTTEIARAGGCEADQGVVYFFDNLGLYAADTADQQPVVVEIEPETGELGAVMDLVKGPSGVFAVTSNGLFRLVANTAESSTSLTPAGTPHVDSSYAYWLEADGIYRVELE